MAEFARGKIEAYVGPTELGAADALEQVIVDFIGGAESTLDIAVQELDNEVDRPGHLDARFRGVSVRMVLEQDYLLTAKLPAVRARAGEDSAAALRRVQWAEETGTRSLAENRRLFGALLRCNVRRQGRLQPGDLPPEVHHPRLPRQGHPDLGHPERLVQLHRDRLPPQPQPRGDLPRPADLR